MTKIRISPEYSAQPSIVKPNPLLEVSVEYVLSNQDMKESKPLKVADYGCGRLRHLYLFLDYFDLIYLVDTEFQLSRAQRLFGRKTTIRQHVGSLKVSKRICVLESSEFESSTLGLDAVFSIAVFDVVLPRTRNTMIKTTHMNLKRGGLFAIIIPRNDSSILRRCSHNNRYYDGHVFNHHGISTFFRNFRKPDQLINRIVEHGFMLVKDLSKYRNVCLLFKKDGANRVVADGA